ncbi:MAG: tetratricopeptide (TPR) repeat protein [Cellvibrionaceae bacterium]
MPSGLAKTKTMTLINPLTQAPFPAHPMSEAGRITAEKNLAEARNHFQQNPNLENTIWLGRRLAYLYLFDEMFDVYAQGIATFPHSYRLLRHRGHRYISTRQFSKAIEDFEKAAALVKDRPVEVEPDGNPNHLNQPTSNGHFNIWYHLGLAYYLSGDFVKAAEAYQACMAYSDNPDSICATVDWHYMSLCRLGRKHEATQLLDLIDPEMPLIESHSYHYRLMMYKGVYTPEQLLNPTDNRPEDRLLTLATQGYGVGTWYLYNGDLGQACRIYNQVLESGFWSAFGYIAAEVEWMNKKT